MRFDSVSARFESVDARFDTIDAQFQLMLEQSAEVFRRFDRIERR